MMRQPVMHATHCDTRIQLVVRVSHMACCYVVHAALVDVCTPVCRCACSTGICVHTCLSLCMQHWYMCAHLSVVVHAAVERACRLIHRKLDCHVGRVF